ncbi:MAG: ISL3 family transposase, partial [Actinomycetota bacterium]|nr:ISL3 family transposase [Actinomycetota bacterium]
MTVQILPSFAFPDRFRAEALIFEGGGVTILASTPGTSARCPLCGHVSRRPHSFYTRTLADLPWGGVPVRFRVRVRRFFCDETGCARRVFAERLDGVAQRYARRTDRQREALDLIAFTLGGEAGTRLAVELGLSISPDTLLNYIRCSPEACYSAPRALGVDDWSLRKGQTYGTILVDLERRRVIDLLPARSADALAAWLRDHPGVEVLARDGSNTYADGAARGAPDAIQVADRFHLVANLREALRQVLERYRERLPPAAPDARVIPESGGCPRSDQERSLLGSYGRPSGREEREREESRARRLERYERMLELRKLGWSIKRMAAEVGVSARTIERWLAAGSFPERKRRTGDSSLLDEYKPYLDRRWEEGCRRVAQLCREIRERGYSASYSTVYEYATCLRTGLPPPRPASKPARARGCGTARAPSPRRLSWLLLRPEEELSSGERGYLGRMEGSVTEIATARALAWGFAAMVRDRQGDRFGGWLEEASGGPPELRSFAEGLRRDREAVAAALSEEWSNGQTEGQVTRLNNV